MSATATKRNPQTGPRTPEGKAASSQNARKHGLTGEKLYVPDEQRQEFEELKASLRNETRPQGAIEEIIFERFLRSSWNLRRIDQLEDELFSTSDPLEDEAAGRKLDRFNRYRATNERSFYRALHELEKLQTNRVLRQETEAELPEDCPPLTVMRDFAKRNAIRKGARRPDPYVESIDREISQMRQDFGGTSATPSPKIPRNARCPCGSGKKYKRCCGVNAPAIHGAAA